MDCFCVVIGHCINWIRKPYQICDMEVSSSIHHFDLFINFMFSFDVKILNFLSLLFICLFFLSFTSYAFVDQCPKVSLKLMSCNASLTLSFVS